VPASEWQTVPSRKWLEFEGGVISALFQQSESALARRGDHAMKTDTIESPAEAAEGTLFLGDDWFDPLEAGVRTRIRGFIEELLEAELDAALGRDRYERPRVAESGRPVVRTGHRHGHRERQLMGTFGPVTVHIPRARLETSDGKTGEWKNRTIPAYQRRTKKADALIAGAYLAGTNTRRVRRALAALWARIRSAEFGAR
jgi:putative transposase